SANDSAKEQKDPMHQHPAVIQTMVPMYRSIQNPGIIRVMDHGTQRRLTTGGRAPLYPCIWTTAPESSNTRIIARCDRKYERYFAYAIAWRIASGPAYQIGPYRNSVLIRSNPSLSLRGRTS